MSENNQCTCDCQIPSSDSVATITSNISQCALDASKLQPNSQLSFHRRDLPPDCISFSSDQGKHLFSKSLMETPNYMEIYFPLAEQFITQAEPAYCGLATLAMCLNALMIDPGRIWKGAWRWFSEELFNCCTPLSVAKEQGISLAQFICLAKCNGALATEFRATTDFTIDTFREIVKNSCSGTEKVVVLNYSRKVLGQTGDGHFSPIGGYNAQEDMVLLLDVARFKYPPHWVTLDLAFASMQRPDSTNGLPRGLVVLARNHGQSLPTSPRQWPITACNEGSSPSGGALINGESHSTESVSTVNLQKIN